MRNMDDYVKKNIAIYDLLADSYAKHVETQSPTIQRQQFISYIPKHGSILDIGCGSGRDSAYFYKQGFQATGVDLSKNLLDIAKKKVPQVVFIQKDIREISFLRDSFNGIWACASLLHIKHKEIPGVLKRFADILKKDGILFIHVKKGIGEEERIEPSIPDKKRFFSFFQKEQLMKLVTDAGFEVIDCFEPPKKKESTTQWISCFAKKI